MYVSDKIPFLNTYKSSPSTTPSKATVRDPYSPWQPYNRALRAKTFLAHMYIAAKALFRGGGTISALCYAPAAAD